MQITAYQPLPVVWVCACSPVVSVNSLILNVVGTHGEPSLVNEMPVAVSVTLLGSVLTDGDADGVGDLDCPFGGCLVPPVMTTATTITSTTTSSAAPPPRIHGSGLPPLDGGGGGGP